MSVTSGGDRRPDRQAALGALLEAEGLDALLVTSRPNMRYLSGFSGSAGIAVATKNSLLVVTDFRYDEQARQQCGAVARVEIEGTSLWDRLFKELGAGALGLGPGSWIGFEAHAISVKDAERFSTGPGAAWRWKAAGELVERLRVRKDAGEIRAIRAAAGVTAAALRDTLAAVRPGQTELEIAGMLEGALRRHGSEAHPFPTIIASGPRSALPHAHTSTRTVAAGEWLLLDFGAVVEGYCADVTRTVVVGRRADASQRALYSLVQEAQRRAREGVRAGMSGREADALARDPIEARGFGAAFGHSTGHGLGLEVHEAPRLARTANDPLPEGAVVTIEPGVYVAGRGGVRIEDDVHLSAEGPVLLTDGCTDLVELV
ncbi:MAG: M24 family metallopeptidase [Gemmatimonadales bacterium]